MKRNPVPILLNGTALPWSDSYKHLGHVLYKDGSSKLDVDLKRRTFIGCFHELRQELKNQYPIVYMNLIMIYMSHFYGSNLWNLFAIDSVYIAWNNVIRNVFGLSTRTHRFLIEPYSEFTHLFTLLTNRFLKFYDTLYLCDKDVISNLRKCQENDCRSDFGLNIRNICQLNDTFDIRQCCKNSVKYFPVDESEIWRVNFLKDLMDSRSSNQLSDLSSEEIELLIEFVACD